MGNSSTDRQPGYINRWLLIGIVIVIALIGAVYALSRNSQPQEPVVPDPAFAAYVSGYTGGVISKKHDILIRLAQAPSVKVQPGDPAESNILSFSPGIKGKLIWKDARTLQFTPAAPMKSGKVYTATLMLDQVMKVSSKKYAKFTFGFQVMPQSFEVKAGHLLAENEKGLSQYIYVGTLVTADQADSAAVEKMISASFEGKKQAIKWLQHDKTTHIFKIENIFRQDSSSNLEIKWSGAPIDVEGKGQQEVVIPAKSDFSMLSATVNPEENAVQVYFSDPLTPQQDLAGLITVDTIKDLTYTVDGNKVTAYLKQAVTGEKTVSVYQGIQNLSGNTLKKGQSLTVNFEDLKPAVRFVKNGNILPSTNGWILPIQAVNLKSVKVRVIKIFQDRIGSFLQANNLDGSEELNRVGRPILIKNIRLDNLGIKNLGHWNRFTLDLTDLIEAEPGAIYQIAVAFGKSDIISPCAATNDNPEGLTAVAAPDENTNTSAFDGESRYFYDGNFGYDYGDDYDWEQRDNPCNSAFYNGRRNVIKKNVLATDIALIAKRGTDNSLVVIATDLVTAKPIPNAEVHIYNFQLQQIAVSNTDKDGIVTFQTAEKPFLAEAVSSHQWSYLKLNDANALSTSQFDVSGSVVQQGIKGYLYGDRGVWRPGDSLYLSFMLEDKEHRLPEDLPVVFEFTNPKGMLVQRTVQTASTEGLYVFATATDADAPTGNWHASVKVGGATFNKIIKIETVKPNRLKIALTFPDDKITPDNQQGKLHVRWLSGATAGNLRADYAMILSPAPTEFKGYKQYHFDDPALNFKTVEKTVFQGQLDPSGDAVIQPGIHLDQPVPATLNAFFSGKVYEPGGNFSVNYVKVPYSPYKNYIGIRVPKGSGYGGMLDLDKDYKISIATVNVNGQPVNMSRLKVGVYKTHWRWWWEENDEDKADFVNSSYFHEVMTKTVSTRNGKADFNLRIKSPNWGRYYIRVSDSASGYATGAFVYFDWPWSEGSGSGNMPGGATRLTFTADKPAYKVGDKMNLYIPGSADGRVLISIENGSHVLKTYWKDVKKGVNQFAIPVTEDMTPNIYVNVSEIQPHGQTVNDLPIRQYGIISLKVEDPTTLLNPQITIPKTVRPNEKVSFTVNEKSGKPMAYTVAIVDEGLLSLTNFKTPDPWNSFYAKEALGVSTWDLYEKVMGAYGARLERLLSIGGDGSAQEPPQSHNLRFKPVVKFFGPFYLEKGKSATHSFVMPNYVGEVRAMVVAGYEGAYGHTDEEVAVKQALMILPTLPRVAGPDETISLPVNVFAMQNDVQNITIKVTTDNHFSILGDRTQTLHLDKPGNSLVFFNLKANELLGTGKIHVEAASGKYKTSSDIDLTVRNPNPPQTLAISKVLAAGESWAPDIKLIGMKGTNTVQLEVAGVPPLNLGKRLSFLVKYPYGCGEQTTSAAFPQLYLDKATTLSQAQKKETDANIKAGIKALGKFQHSSGGFTYWPGSNYPDDWVTSYIGNFLLEAKKKGYNVLNDMLVKWAGYQTQRADSWQPRKSNWDDLIQAYRLYTLALAQKPDWSAMNRMQGLDNLSLQAKWRLADAYVLAGRTDVAEKLINKLSFNIPDYRSMAYTYGSSLRDKAMILQTLNDMGNRGTEAFELARSISDKLNSDSWLSTQETAYSLIALTEFFSRYNGVTKVNYDYKLNGGAFKSEETALPTSSLDIPVANTPPELTVKNTAKGTLYATVTIHGTPATGNEQFIQNGLNMQVHYSTMGGKPLNPSDLVQGTDFIAEVRIQNPGTKGDYKNMALTQIFPSGWEIRNTRMEDAPDVREASVPDYQDIRDDRVYTHFDLARGETKTFRIQLNATYAGKFYLPAVKCAAMYDNSIIAVQPGQWVEVKPR